MHLIDGLRQPTIQEWPCLSLEDLPEGMSECALVGFDGQEVVAHGIQDLPTEGALTEE